MKKEKNKLNELINGLSDETSNSNLMRNSSNDKINFITPKKNIKMPKFFKLNKHKEIDSSIIFNEIINEKNNLMSQLNKDTKPTEVFSPIANNKNNVVKNLKKMHEDFYYNNNFNYEKEDLICEENFNKLIVKEKKTISRKKIIPIISRIFIYLIVIYIIFLSLGITKTKSTKINETKLPIIMSVNDISKVKQYEKLTKLYFSCQNALKETLKIDSELQKEKLNKVTAPMEYAKILKKVDKLIIEIEAEKLDVEFSPIQNLMLTWVTGKNCVGALPIYLQNITNYLINDNQKLLNKVEISRQQMFSNFNEISNNFNVLKKSIKGASCQDNFTWNAEDYYKKFNSKHQIRRSFV